ncbi:MAG TPA: NAD(+)/NADH kinase [Coriobacteriia bacterium]|nr:NAD(+)/NADH kinase [Coriobacteriia bacterium]
MRVLIVPNTANPRAVDAAAELVTWLTGAGVEPVMTSGDAEGCGLPAVGVPASDIGAPALAVALGGDGTILKAFHALGDVEVPLLGVKFGRLGFLAGAEPETMRQSVEAALAGEARIERRATLRADVYMEGRVNGSYRALNEVVVSRGASARVVALRVSVDDHAITDLRADGVIVATATGSTAYALSAGGPIVAPGFGGLVVVPVAAHTLQARPLVTGATDEVSIELSDPARSDACVVVDGDLAPSRRTIERVVVRRGDHDLSLVKLHGRDFYETVADEFFGG